MYMYPANPVTRGLRSGDSALVLLTPRSPLVVEPMATCPKLGRFTMRDMKAVVAVGVVRGVRRANVTLAAFRAEENE